MAYHIARDNQKLGVFDPADIQRKLASGELLSSDLCWTDGMAEWQPLDQVNLNPTRPPPPFEGDEENLYSPPSSQNLAAASQTAFAPLATLGQRFAAAMLDLLSAMIGYIPLVMGIGIDAVRKILENPEALETLELSPNWSLVGLALTILITLLIANLIMLANQGQTIGKRLMGIRIVDVERDVNPGWVRTILLRSVANSLIASVPLIGGFYSLIDVLFIFGKERRCIHDLIATTRVIQVQPN